jgi:hypothetical protein
VTRKILPRLYLRSAYTFARIGAVVRLKVEDYYPSGKRFLLSFKEKGGKEKELRVHHKLEEILDQYLKATGLEKEPGSPLFPAAWGKTGKLLRRPLRRTDAADMLKRRLKQAGLPAHYSLHSFRATGITNFLENDGTLEAAQRIAGHADSRTTKLYDRRGQKVLPEDVGRIRFDTEEAKGFYRSGHPVTLRTHLFRAIDNPAPKDSYTGKAKRVYKRSGLFK